MKYDELPKRGKVTSDGIETRKCSVCGSRCYVFYVENETYHVECERNGIIANFKAKSLDEAIKIWNGMER
jgi:hypothetical protein